MLWTEELASRIGLVNPNAKVLSLHPGVARTELSRSFSLGWRILHYLASPLFWFFSKNQQQGAQTSLYAVMSDHVKTGAYYSDCKEARKAKSAEDPLSRKRVWERSE